MSNFLQKVNSPKDLKMLTESELYCYAQEVREYITETVSRQGGHLSSNLGSIELTIALHYVFDSPNDKLLFDVGHQAYAHKIITGRRDAFMRLRTDEGASAFMNASESEYDAFTMGHSSTSLSVGVGLARSRAITGENYNVVCVIGDGAFTGGLAFEALNDIGAKKEKMIIVLNDNKMSISKNVGAFSQYLSKLRLSKKYAAVKHTIKNGASALPFVGNKLVNVLDKLKDNVKMSLIGGKIFENFGVKYYGPIDGHDVKSMIEMLRRMKNVNGPVVLHVVTKKGNGVEIAEQNPDKFHGVGGQNVTLCRSFSKLVGEKLTELAANNEKIVAVTAAMASGTGLDVFARQYPHRFYDVGIAEGHAMTMCAGLAVGGVKPYFAVYSSFLQRAFDQIAHDVCIDALPVTMLIDHAGIVGGDGVTHQGIYDISYLLTLPNVTILQPKDGAELAKMLEFSAEFTAPLAIRYAKSYERDYEQSEFSDLTWEYVRKTDSSVYVLAAGNRMLSLALSVDDVNVINARVINPLDKNMLDSIANARLIITLEDGVLSGGFGWSVRNYYANRAVNVECLGYGDDFLVSCDEKKMLENAGMTVNNIENIIKKYT